jgi:ethanolamine ammonia-lyase large subunit
MLNYQSTSFHDALAMRRLFGFSAAPEFQAWLDARGLPSGRGLSAGAAPERPRLLAALESLGSRLS